MSVQRRGLGPSTRLSCVCYGAAENSPHRDGIQQPVKVHREHAADHPDMSRIFDLVRGGIPIVEGNAAERPVALVSMIRWHFCSSVVIGFSVMTSQPNAIAWQI